VAKGFLLTPPYPNPFTLILRYFIYSGQGVRLLTTFSRPFLKSTITFINYIFLKLYRTLEACLLFGLSCLTPIVGGMQAFSRQRTALIMPAKPLAPSVWPKFVLIEPISRGFSGDLDLANTFPMAVHSIGSPTVVSLGSVLSL